MLIQHAEGVAQQVAGMTLEGAEGLGPFGSADGPNGGEGLEARGPGRVVGGEGFQLVGEGVALAGG